MSASEIGPKRVAHFYENYPTRDGLAEQFYVSQEQLDEQNKVYVVNPASVKQPHLEGRVVRQNLAPDLYEFTFEKPFSAASAAMLAHAAFREVAKENRNAQVVALMPYSLDNPETNLDLSGTYVDVLGMEGQGLTRDGEVIFVGTVEDVVGMAHAALAYKVKAPLYRSPHLPPEQVA